MQAVRTAASVYTAPRKSARLMQREEDKAVVNNTLKTPPLHIEEQPASQVEEKPLVKDNERLNENNVQIEAKGSINLQYEENYILPNLAVEQRTDPLCKEYIDYLTIRKLPDNRKQKRYVLATHQSFYVDNSGIL